MANFKDEIRSHIMLLDKQLNFEEVTNKPLIVWIEPLLNSFTDDGAISYLLNKDKRFRASPLSSTLEWLNNSNFIPINAIDTIQSKLIFLRDNNQPSDSEVGNTQKKPGDELGWSLSEGVSVWSTSTAILALFDKYGNWKKHISVIKESTIWLIKQRKINSVWSYQLNDNCTENIVMTSLAIRAICKLAINKAEFSITTEEKNLISEALHNGYIYISNNIKKDKKRNCTYWEFRKQENCAATTWALLALKDLKDVEGFEIQTDKIKNFYNNNLLSSMSFILSKIPKKSERWTDEQIVFEGGAKYNKQKNYQSFSATLLPQLFELGLSPYHPKVVNQIKWLINNPTEWKIENYDRSNICSFSYAMVLSTISNWIKRVGNINSSILLKNPSNKSEYIYKLIFGQLSQKSEPYQMISKSRLKIYSFVIIFILILIFVGPSILALTQNLIKSFISLFIENVNDIIVNLIASVIYAIVAGVVLYIYNKVKCKLRRGK